MNTITIRKIGPIMDVTLELNKVNIIMGPQSSGKSTIAKIISYCQWVEKRFILDGEYKDDFAERFMEFHRLSEAYFNENSFIEYCSNCVQIKYDGILHIQSLEKIRNAIEYVNSKNIYIPAERNFVSAIRNLRKYKSSTNDNIMNFVYDWSEVRDNYQVSSKYTVLDLGVSYYYNQDSDTDMIVLDNEKEMALGYASSGLQSVIPMLVAVDFMTSTLYDKKVVESVDEKEQMAKVLLDYIYQLDENRKTDVLTDLEKKNKLSLSNEELTKFVSLYENRKEYHHSQFIIEEPEQNLFPQTQRDLVYYLLNKVNDKDREHKLLLTTHSPYVLYALNNCMMGGLVYEKMSEQDKNRLKCKLSVINPSLISAYEIHDGKLKPIQQKDGLIGANYLDNKMKELMDDFYVLLNYYGR